MDAPLYNTDILRLAASIPCQARLAAPAASVERRSPTCGSRVTVDVAVDGEGRLAELGLSVHACALGQAASAVMARHAIGRSEHELREARDALGAWLSGERAAPPEWPGIHVFAPALPHRGRHPAILLPFDAVADAVRKAVG